MGRSYHREFLHDLVLTLYENHHKGDEEDREGISFWKRRHGYYVRTTDNPVEGIGFQFFERKQPRRRSLGRYNHG